MGKLIVDDNPIFTRVLKKCLWRAVFEFDLNTQTLCLEKLACMTFENFKKCAALRCKQSANQTNNCQHLRDPYTFMVYVRWLKWWCGWECAFPS